ncbi:MAG: o-succinylbenzoate synthase [Flavobacteriales bacterium]|nr:o-succinylbenzoate synthase [Flavobacteriales bacterium]
MNDLICEVKSHTLSFLRAAKTSRDTLLEKEVWYIRLSDRQGKYGFGEIAPLFGLSVESRDEVLGAIRQMVTGLHPPEAYSSTPSVRAGLEMALLDLNYPASLQYADNAFVKGEQSQTINGLIWMGDPAYMHEQIEQKLALGFHTIKLKIGALDFEKELSLLSGIRQRFSPEEITIRVDANGAFGDDALHKLDRLARLNIHSIEQPIRAGQPAKMAQLCRSTPLPIALDEELIGTTSCAQKRELLDYINPQHIILKPSLIGGFSEANDWIQIAGTYGIPWWATSALESNLGLSAIAQWTAGYNNDLPQGLGTGQLFSNNCPGRLQLEGEKLWHHPESECGFEQFWNGLDSVQ